jgi:hypothetical protein
MKLLLAVVVMIPPVQPGRSSVEEIAPQMDLGPAH